MRHPGELPAPLLTVMGHPYLLGLANGSLWAIEAADRGAEPIVAACARVASLPRRPAGTPPARRLVLSTDRGLWESLEGETMVDFFRCRPGVSAGGAAEEVLCAVPPHYLGEERFPMNVMLTLYAVAAAEVRRGAALIHGATAERDGHGVLLAGKSEVGKSTASRRLPAPWRSLCDDISLVLPDGEGNWHAHPFPTWGRIFAGDLDGRWDVPRAVRLDAVFFLEQSGADRARAVGPGEGLCLLNEVAEQASWPIYQYRAGEQIVRFRRRLFDNIAALAAAVPGYRLELSRGGEFWREMERAVA